MMLSVASLHGDLSPEAPDPSSSAGLGTEFGLSVNQAAEAPTAALADSHIAGFTRSQEWKVEESYRDIGRGPGRLRAGAGKISMIQ